MYILSSVRNFMASNTEIKYIVAVHIKNLFFFKVFCANDTIGFNNALVQWLHDASTICQ